MLLYKQPIHLFTSFCDGHFKILDATSRVVTESFIHGTDNVAVSARDEERWKSLFTPAMKRVVDGHT